VQVERTEVRVPRVVLARCEDGIVKVRVVSPSRWEGSCASREAFESAKTNTSRFGLEPKHLVSTLLFYVRDTDSDVCCI